MAGHIIIGPSQSNDKDFLGCSNDFPSCPRLFQVFLSLATLVQSRTRGL